MQFLSCCETEWGRDRSARMALAFPITCFPLMCGAVCVLHGMCRGIPGLGAALGAALSFIYASRKGLSRDELHQLLSDEVDPFPPAPKVCVCVLMAAAVFAEHIVFFWGGESGNLAWGGGCSVEWESCTGDSELRLRFVPLLLVFVVLLSSQGPL